MTNTKGVRRNLLKYKTISREERIARLEQTIAELKGIKTFSRLVETYKQQLKDLEQEK